MDICESKRLILDHFQPEDKDDYYHILKPKCVYQWLGTGREVSKDQVLKIINKNLKHWDDYKIGTWAIKLKNEKKIIGHCGFNYIDKLNNFELLYALDKAYWDKGYASEAAKASLNWARQFTNLEKVIVLSYPNNERSIKVINKLGFKYLEQRELFGVLLKVYELYLK